MNTALSIETLRAALANHAPEIQPSTQSPRNAAVAIVLAPSPTGELCALFMQRAEHPDDPWSGQMSFPGGGVEPSDASLMHGAIRETLEEVGLPLDESMCLGRLHDHYGGRLQIRQLAVSPFVFYCPDPPPLVHNEEVADTVWVPLTYMSDPQHSVPYSFKGDPEGREFPSFQYQNYTIWGLTYRMLRDFFALVEVALPSDPDMND